MEVTKEEIESAPLAERMMLGVGAAVRQKYGDIGAFRGRIDPHTGDHVIMADNRTSHPINMARYLAVKK